MAEDAPERPFYVRPGEEVLLSEGPAVGYAVSIFLGLATFWTVLAGLAAAAGAYAAGTGGIPLFGANSAGLGSPYLGEIGLAYGLALAASALFAWRRQATSEYVVTDERIYRRVGRLRTRVHLTAHDRVSDVRYERGIWDRLVGVAGLEFTTAGGDVAFPGLGDASRVQEVALGARDDFVQRLLERAGVEEPAAPAREAPAAAEDVEADEGPVEVDPSEVGLAAFEGEAPEYVRSGERVLWSGKPTLRSAVGAMATIVPVLFFVAVGGLLSGPFSAFLLPAVAVFVVLPVAVQVARIRFTELTVTDRRVYLRRGIVATSVNQTTFPKITDITYEQSILGRILGYARVEVDTSGGMEAPIQVGGLADAQKVKALLERAAEGEA